MKKKILVTANDFGSSKNNPGQRPKHHFCCGDMGKKVKYHKRRSGKITRRYEVFPAQAIHMLLKIPATRTPQGALKFVALIIKILSCNKKKKIHQNYHNCSTLVADIFCEPHETKKTSLKSHLII
jgi:hypothetical protein